MYVARICRNNLVVEATLIDKRWSDEMLSHEIVNIKKRNFLFKRSANNWIKKEIISDLVSIGKMEMENG